MNKIFSAIKAAFLTLGHTVEVVPLEQGQAVDVEATENGLQCLHELQVKGGHRFIVLALVPAGFGTAPERGHEAPDTERPPASTVGEVPPGWLQPEQQTAPAGASVDTPPRPGDAPLAPVPVAAPVPEPEAAPIAPPVDALPTAPAPVVAPVVAPEPPSPAPVAPVAPQV